MPSRGQECPRHTQKPKGKGHQDFSQWPLFMPATTYSPTPVWGGHSCPPNAGSLSLFGAGYFSSTRKGSNPECHHAGRSARATLKNQKEKAIKVSPDGLYLCRQRPTLPHP